MIERVREYMNMCIKRFGLNDRRTIRASQILDVVIVKETKKSM